MNISSNGLSFIKQFEGFSSKPYLDSAGVPTIGYGTIMYPSGRKVSMSDQPITEEQGLNCLEFDIQHRVRGISCLVRAVVNQNQADALISFAYNEGLGALQTSTLLKLLNSNDVHGAANEFPKWDKAKVDGRMVTVQGLLNRRLAEQRLFLSPVV